MAKTFKPNQIISGTYGKVMIGEEELANIKTFEAKITGEFEDVKVANKLGVYKKLLGFTGEGTLTMHKVDSSLQKKVAEALATGEMPDIKIIAELNDPQGKGAERVEILDVTFTEVALLQFEVGAIAEVEMPFSFADYNYIQSIE